MPPSLSSLRRLALRGAVCAALAASGLSIAQTGVPDLRFGEMFQMPAGPRGLQPGKAMLAFDGQRVRITGFMVTQEDAPVGRFFLTPVPLRMSESADGDADDLPLNAVVVLMPPAEQNLPLPHTPGLLQLTGILHYGRHELPDGRVVWLRLQLDPRPSSS